MNLEWSGLLHHIRKMSKKLPFLCSNHFVQLVAVSWHGVKKLMGSYALHTATLIFLPLWMRTAICHSKSISLWHKFSSQVPETLSSQQGTSKAFWFCQADTFQLRLSLLLLLQTVQFYYVLKCTWLGAVTCLFRWVTRQLMIYSLVDWYSLAEQDLAV
jgi:hypothetical protein